MGRLRRSRANAKELRIAANVGRARAGQRQGNRNWALLGRVGQPSPGSSSFLKKEPKNFCSVGWRGRHDRHLLMRVKVFWFFFSKKNCLLPGLRAGYGRAKVTIPKCDCPDANASLPHSRLCLSMGPEFNAPHKPRPLKPNSPSSTAPQSARNDPYYS